MIPKLYFDILYSIGFTIAVLLVAAWFNNPKL